MFLKWRFIRDFRIVEHFNFSRVRAGVCDFGFNFMLCENPSLRAKHKILGDLTGVLVTKVSPLGAAAIGGLKELDVLCEIKGRKIKNDGIAIFYHTDGHMILFSRLLVNTMTFKRFTLLLFIYICYIRLLNRYH